MNYIKSYFKVEITLAACNRTHNQHTRGWRKIYEKAGMKSTKKTEIMKNKKRQLKKY